MAKTAEPVTLQRETLRAFESYIQEAEARMAPSLEGREPFLWSDATAARAQAVRKGSVLAEWWAEKRPGSVPNGLVHDWVGAVGIPHSTLQETLTVVQDYGSPANRHQAASLVSTPSFDGLGRGRGAFRFRSAAAAPGFGRFHHQVSQRFLRRGDVPRAFVGQFIPRVARFVSRGLQPFTDRLARCLDLLDGQVQKLLLCRKIVLARLATAAEAPPRKRKPRPT